MISPEVFINTFSLHRHDYSMWWIAKKLCIQRNRIAKHIIEKKVTSVTSGDVYKFVSIY